VLLPSEAARSRSNVFYEIGRLSFALQKWDEAQKNFEEAIAADGVNYAAYFTLGNSFEEQNQFDKALAAYKRVLELSPASGAAEEAMKRVTLILAFKKEEEKNVERETMYVSAFLSGAEALDDKHYEAASKYFAEALAIRSDDAVVWVGFAEARAHLGDSSGAITSLERALERDPGNEEAKSKLDAIIAERNAQNKKPARRSTSRPRSFIQRSISGAGPLFEQDALSSAQVIRQLLALH
jgi:tetratricopeptide (TPR) repeat protein